VTSSYIFPELVVGREDNFIDGYWRVLEGFARRGEASCDFYRRELRVPLGSTALDRVVRAHELVHVRVSPHDVSPSEIYPELPVRVLQCAEEFRVNEILRRLGFDIHLLRDGSEKFGATQLAMNNNWEEAVYFFLAVLGTGGEKEFLSGLRPVQPDWVKALRTLKSKINSLIVDESLPYLGATLRGDYGLPAGYVNVSVEVSRIAMTAASARVPIDPAGLRLFRRSLEVGARRPATGRFAELRFDETLEYQVIVGRRLRKVRRGSPNGTSLRYPSRLLTDPQRRAFARRQRVAGGVVVVDQSGSMAIDEGVLSRMLRDVPGVLVVGYSHRPGDREGVANAWILADRGRRCVNTIPGNVGNGVDGPILRWALRQRRQSERILWVTDGQVTDSNDHPDERLTQECASLVQRGSIELVATVEAATKSLTGTLDSHRHELSKFGRVGRELLQNRHVTGPR
jgi:hypothetical protein